MKFKVGSARTLGGFKVTILCVDARGSYPIVGLIHSKNEVVDDPHSWTADGVYQKNRPSQTMDLTQRETECEDIS